MPSRSEGVIFCRSKGKKWNGRWKGVVYDRSDRLATTRKPRKCTTAGYTDRGDCVRATRELRMQVEAKVAAALEAMANELDHTRDLPLRPASAAQAEANVVYYGEAFHADREEGSKSFRAERYVRVPASRERFAYATGCRHGVGKHACVNAAVRGYHCPEHKDVG